MNRVVARESKEPSEQMTEKARIRIKKKNRMKRDETNKDEHPKEINEGQTAVRIGLVSHITAK